MNDSTKPLALAPNPRLRTQSEAARMAPGQAPGGNLPARTGATAGNAEGCDVIQVLKAKRDRYKGRGKLIQAATVQACIAELRVTFQNKGEK